MTIVCKISITCVSSVTCESAMINLWINQYVKTCCFYLFFLILFLFLSQFQFKYKVRANIKKAVLCSLLYHYNIVGMFMTQLWLILAHLFEKKNKKQNNIQGIITVVLLCFCHQPYGLTSIHSHLHCQQLFLSEQNSSCLLQSDLSLSHLSPHSKILNGAYWLGLAALVGRAISESTQTVRLRNIIREHTHVHTRFHQSLDLLVFHI